MNEILIFNPILKKRKAHKKNEVKAMPKKRRIKRNPTAKFGRTRRAASKIGRSFMGLQFAQALKSLPAYQLGMFSAKFAAKLGGTSASEEDPGSWNWASYIKAALGGVVSGIALNMFKPGTGQKVLEGSLNFMAFKLIQNELISKNTTAKKWLGADEEELVFTGEEAYPELITVEGDILPADNEYRIAGQLEPPGRLGATLEPQGAMGDVYARAFGPRN